MDKTALKRLLVSGYFWAFFGRVITAIAGMFANALLARLLQPSELGAYFLIVSMVTVLSMIGMLGLQRAVVQVVSDAVARGLGGRACRSITLSIALVTGASGLIALLMSGPGPGIIKGLLDSDLIPPMMGLAAVLLIVRALSSVYAEIFRAFHNIRSAVFYNGTFVNLIFAILLGLVYVNSEIATLQLVLVLSIAVYALNTGVAWLQSRGWCSKLTREGNIKVGELLVIAFPLMVTTLMLFVISQADLWVVGAMLDEQAVALYGAAIKLVQLIAIPLMITNAVLPSIIADLYARGDLRMLEKVLRTSAMMAGLPAAFMLVVIIVGAEDILELVYGDYYRMGAPVLIIISIGQLINVVAGTGLIVLMMVGMQVYIMIISLVSGLLLVGGCLYVAGDYGVEGIATVVSVVLALQALIVLLVVRVRVGVWSHVGLGGMQALIRHLKNSGKSGG